MPLSWHRLRSRKAVRVYHCVGEQCSRLRRVAGMCSSTVSDTANMRIHERTQCVSAEEKILCRSPVSQRSHVGNLRQTKK